MPASRPAALAAAGLGLALLGASSARPAAATVAFNFDPNDPNAPFAYDNASDGITQTNPTATSSELIGWEFSANAPITVTSLGYLALPGATTYSPSAAIHPDGSITGGTTVTPTSQGTHQVGLYLLTNPDTPSETATLLTSAPVVLTGTTTDGFFYTPVLAGPTLLAGDTYVIAGVSGPSDPYAFGLSSTDNSVGADPSLTYIQGRSQSGNALSLTAAPPVDTNNGVAYFGPNFQFTPALSAAPEPSEFAALGVFALGLGGLLLRARRRAARAS